MHTRRTLRRIMAMQRVMGYENMGFAHDAEPPHLPPIRSRKKAKGSATISFHHDKKTGRIITKITTSSRQRKKRRPATIRASRKIPSIRQIVAEMRKRREGKKFKMPKKGSRLYERYLGRFPSQSRPSRQKS